MINASHKYFKFKITVSEEWECDFKLFLFIHLRVNVSPRFAYPPFLLITALALALNNDYARKPEPLIISNAAITR